MPVYTCEYTFNGKRHLLTSLAESQQLAIEHGFKVAVRGMQAKGKAELDETTIQKFETPAEANAHAVQWAKDNKRPLPGDETQARLAREQVTVPKPPGAEPEDDDE